MALEERHGPFESRVGALVLARTRRSVDRQSLASLRDPGPTGSRRVAGPVSQVDHEVCAIARTRQPSNQTSRDGHRPVVEHKHRHVAPLDPGDV